MALQEQLKREGDYLFKYRGYLPIIFLVFALAVRGLYMHYGSNNSAVISSISAFMQSIALYIGLFGVLVRLYTVGFTPKNTSGRNTSEGQIADELNTTGLYSLTRNPLYVGNFFMWMGLVFYIGVIWFSLLFICMFWIYYERIIFAEETFLREKFKESYIQWANKKAVFIPKKFRYVHPQKSFRWKKIVIKEKSTILMFFLVFFILQQFSAFFEFNATQIELSQITYGFLASIALYALIKSLQVLGKLSTE